MTRRLSVISLCLPPAVCSPSVSLVGRHSTPRAAEAVSTRLNSLLNTILLDFHVQDCHWQMHVISSRRSIVKEAKTYRCWHRLTVNHSTVSLRTLYAHQSL